MNKIYYEVPHPNGGIKTFDSLDDAIIFADNNGAKIISEVGGSWTDFEKCWFCEEWFDSCELNSGGTCGRCEVAIEDHCGKQ